MDANTRYLDIALEGPGGFRLPIVPGEGMSAGRSSANPRLQLEPGGYRVVITNGESPGTAAVYLKLP